MIFLDNLGKTIITISVLLLCGVWWYLQMSPHPTGDISDANPALNRLEASSRKPPVPTTTTAPSTRPVKSTAKIATKRSRMTGQSAAKPSVTSSETPADNQMDPQAPTEPELYAPEARKVLGSVGVDPQAFRVWVEAINDLDVPPEERQDLIEDLNEDGFKDPDNITEDEIPLVHARLELIESLAPFAADEVNANAFAEAYKDLIGMLPIPEEMPEPEPEPDPK